MGQLVAIHRGSPHSGGVFQAGDETQEELMKAQSVGEIVTLVANEVYAACQEAGLEYVPGDFGEHFTVEWIAVDTLQAGDHIHIGEDVTIEVSFDYPLPDWLENREDIRELIEEPIGVQGRVIQGGDVAVDMMVHVELSEIEEDF